jgi:hypothetical protein
MENTELNTKGKWRVTFVEGKPKGDLFEKDDFTGQVVEIDADNINDAVDKAKQQLNITKQPFRCFAKMVVTNG